MASYRVSSGGGMTVATAAAVTTVTSPKSQCGSGGDAQHGGASVNTATSPKGQCLCSPTTHQGSFRCKFHRSNSTAYFKRSKSMPINQNNSPKSVDSS